MSGVVPSPWGDTVAIVGIGQTEFAPEADASATELAARAVAAALEDGGLEAGEVEGLCSLGDEPVGERTLAANLGLGDLAFCSRVGPGTGGSCAAAAQAALAVAAGQARVVVIWRTKRAVRPPAPWLDVAPWRRPFGLLRAADEVALQTRRFLHDRGAPRQALAEVVLAARAYARNNPGALLRDHPLSAEDYGSAQWLSEPLCVHDQAVKAEGAVALVVAGARRAADCAAVPAMIHAFGQGLIGSEEPGDPPPAVAEPGSSRRGGAGIWARSELGPGDVRAAQLDDTFSPFVLFALEAYGFCGPGEAPSFVADGGLGPGGRLAVNTSGGALAEAGLDGFNLLVEAVRQLRGTSPNQVPASGAGGAEACLVTSGAAMLSSALLLRVQ